MTEAVHGSPEPTGIPLYLPQRPFRWEPGKVLADSSKMYENHGADLFFCASMAVFGGTLVFGLLLGLR